MRRRLIVELVLAQVPPHRGARVARSGYVRRVILHRVGVEGFSSSGRVRVPWQGCVCPKGVSLGGGHTSSGSGRSSVLRSGIIIILCPPWLRLRIEPSYGIVGRPRVRSCCSICLIECPEGALLGLRGPARAEAFAGAVSGRFPVQQLCRIRPGVRPAACHRTPGRLPDVPV